MKTPFQIKKRGASEGQEETFVSKHGGQHASSCTCTPDPTPLKPTTRSYVDHRICRLAEFGSATLQSPRRWLPRAVCHRTRIDGRAYWHRVSQARPSNLISPLKQKQCVLLHAGCIRASQIFYSVAPPSNLKVITSEGESIAPYRSTKRHYRPWGL